MNQFFRNKATHDFIKKHTNDDVQQLALKADKFPDVDIRLALQQIEGRQKIKTKIPFFYKQEGLVYPVRLSLEQCSSEITAQYKSGLCSGNILVDLSGGFGVDCYFMSRHFISVFCLERDAELSAIQKHNFKLLNRTNIETICSDSIKYIKHFSAKADWIYIDPARRKLSGQKAVLLSDCEPNIKEIIPLLLQKSNSVMVKLSPMIDISATLTELENIHEVHIVAIENECKEVLLILKKESNNDSVHIITKNFVKETEQSFSFEIEQEKSTTVKYASNIQKYLYEPNAAIMKSGGFKSIAKKYDLEKLHPNTHLYFSNELKNGFVGRVFAVKSSWSNSQKKWKEQLKRLEYANISTRNYPLNATELRKKIKLKDGGDTYLFACTLNNGEKTILECEKINNTNS